MSRSQLRHDFRKWARLPTTTCALANAQYNCALSRRVLRRFLMASAAAAQRSRAQQALAQVRLQGLAASAAATWVTSLLTEKVVHSVRVSISRKQVGSNPRECSAVAKGEGS